LHLDRFAQADIHDSALDLIDALLSRIEAARTPEKVAENDHLMKCTSYASMPPAPSLLNIICIRKGTMRIIVTARQTLTPGYEQILGRLVTILGVISKNPSNPMFDQYIFESISGLMRCVLQAIRFGRREFF
jgi:exportin-2 (importin alpha re-exporter)